MPSLLAVTVVGEISLMIDRKVESDRRVVIHGPAISAAWALAVAGDTVGAAATAGSREVAVGEGLEHLLAQELGKAALADAVQRYVEADVVVDEEAQGRSGNSRCRRRGRSPGGR